MDAVRLPEDSKSTRDLNMLGSSYLHQSSGAVRVLNTGHEHNPTAATSPLPQVQRSASHHCHTESRREGETPFSLTWRKDKSVMQSSTIQTWSVA